MFICKAFAKEIAQYKIGAGATDLYFLRGWGRRNLSRAVNLVRCYIGEEYNPLFLIIQEGFS